MIDDSNLAVDKINAVLNGLRLRWLKTPGEANLLPYGKEYGLIPLKNCSCGCSSCFERYIFAVAR